jgi:serum/glucocorticoid-regulated kinase 2
MPPTIEHSIEDFDLLNIAGQGSVGTVWFARKKDTQEAFAVKIIEKHATIGCTSLTRILAEREILSTLDHQNVVTLHFAFQDATRIYFVMDYMGGGDLYKVLKQFPEKQLPEDAARFYAAEILLALEYLHSYNIVFRDLKPENVLLSSEGRLKVADFGLAKKSGTSALRNKGSVAQTARHHTVCGTPEYMAPEVIGEKAYGRMVDYWALGLLIFEMLAGRSPWADLSLTDMFFRILTEDPVFPDNMSVDARDLISSLLVKDPSKRLGCRNPGQLMRHPFFYGLDFTALKEGRLDPPKVVTQVCAARSNHHRDTRDDDRVCECSSYSSTPPTHSPTHSLLPPTHLFINTMCPLFPQ